MRTQISAILRFHLAHAFFELPHSYPMGLRLFMSLLSSFFITECCLSQLFLELPRSLLMRTEIRIALRFHVPQPLLELPYGRLMGLRLLGRLRRLLMVQRRLL
jgi:hypothetical protein